MQIEGWAIAVTVVALPWFLFLMFKLFTATTYKSRLIYFASAMASGMVLSIVTSAGLKLDDETLHHVRNAPPAGEILSRLPVTVFVSMALWFIGANLIAVHQLRKAGRPWWEAFVPFAPTFRYFDRKAWIALLGLAIISLIIISHALEPSTLTNLRAPSQLTDKPASADTASAPE